MLGESDEKKGTYNTSFVDLLSRRVFILVYQVLMMSIYPQIELVDIPC
jgi:predicted component of type VI protein secretion system